MFFSFPFWCQMLVNVRSVIKQNFVLQVKNNFNYLLSFSWSLCFISCFSQKINLFWIAKLVQDCKGRIVALGLFCTDLTAISSYRQDLGLIFPQYCPCVWLLTKDILYQLSGIFICGMLQWRVAKHITVELTKNEHQKSFGTSLHNKEKANCVREN